MKTINFHLATTFDERYTMEKKKTKFFGYIVSKFAYLQDHREWELRILFSISNLRFCVVETEEKGTSTSSTVLLSYWYPSPHPIPGPLRTHYSTSEIERHAGGKEAPNFLNQTKTSRRRVSPYISERNSCRNKIELDRSERLVCGRKLLPSWPFPQRNIPSYATSVESRLPSHGVSFLIVTSGYPPCKLGVFFVADILESLLKMIRPNHTHIKKNLDSFSSPRSGNVRFFSNIDHCYFIVALLWLEFRG